MTTICEVCGGRGWDGEGNECLACDGTGKDDEPQPIAAAPSPAPEQQGSGIDGVRKD